MEKTRRQMIIKVKVRPNSSKQKIEKLENEYIIHLKSPAKNNRANSEMINLLAKEFKVPVKSIKIKTGKTSKKKIVEIG